MLQNWPYQRKSYPINPMLEFGSSIERTQNCHMTVYNSIQIAETNANKNSNFFVHKKHNNIYLHYPEMNSYM